MRLLLLLLRPSRLSNQRKNVLGSTFGQGTRTRTTYEAAAPSPPDADSSSGTHTHTTGYENRAAATTSESWPDVPGGSAPCLITAASLQHSRGAQHRACRLGYTSTFYFLFVFFVFVLFLCSAAAVVVVLGVQMGNV